MAVQKLDRYETAVLLTLERKKVRAVINTGLQDARMGRGVLSFLKSKGPVNLSKRVVRSIFGLETLQATSIRLGSDDTNSYSVLCYVDERLPEFELVLGLRTLVCLGHRISVCGLESHERRIVEESVSTNNRKRERDEDEISFLDQKEAKRMREWFG